VEVLRTPTDLGIKDVCKEALLRSRGEFIVAQQRHRGNAGWLNALTALANKSEGYGLTGR